MLLTATLISIPLSWVHNRLSTQTTCHEQSQSEKLSSYGFLWLLYNLIMVGLVCTPYRLTRKLFGSDKDPRYTTSLLYFSTETGAA